MLNYQRVKCCKKPGQSGRNLGEMFVGDGEAKIGIVESMFKEVGCYIDLVDSATGNLSLTKWGVEMSGTGRIIPLIQVSPRFTELSRM